jgi:hypothetical protein
VLGLCDERFRPLLDQLGARVFEESADTIYGLWSDFSLAYTNPRWATFALENDGAAISDDWGLGRSVLESCGEALEPFYARAWRRALREGRPWLHRYMCSSPTSRRWFVMRVLPIADRALLVSNSLLVETSLAAGFAPSDESAYRSPDGLVRQCSHCRRVRAVDSATPDRWDFVPQLLAFRRSASVSHVLCPLCLSYHYHHLFDPDELQATLDAALDVPRTRS